MKNTSSEREGGRGVKRENVRARKRGKRKRMTRKMRKRKKVCERGFMRLGVSGWVPVVL